MINGAQLTLEVLQKNQVECVFGYPGGAIMPIYDALFDSDVKHYLCRHEQGAAFAALGYAKSTGKVGVCFATSGPGVTNLITGLADATADSVPIVAITGQVPSALMGTDAFQEIDVLGLALGVTKHAFQVTDASELEETLEKAFEIAASGRPGAVIVDIPKDVQVGEAKRKNQMLSAVDLIEVEHFNKRLKEDLDLAKKLLTESQKPILYVGGGVSNANAVEELRDFLKASNMPSVSTLKGLGAINPNQEGYLGMLGMHGAKSANLSVQSSDLLVAIGARFDDRVTGKLNEFAPSAKVIHLDIDAAEINKLRASHVSLLGDFRQLIPMLHEGVVFKKEVKNWRDYCEQQKRITAYRYLESPKSSEIANKQSELNYYPICAPSLLRLLSKRLPKNSVVTTDVGQHQMWVAQHMEFDEPRNFLTSGALGTMGYGLPAAVGAQIARIKDTVVAVSGDGSLMMNIQEMATIKRFGLPVKILLIDNTKLGMVRQWQSLFFDKRFSETDLSDNPDFVGLANAFDIPGQTIFCQSEVEHGVNRMLEANGAYLLHVKINENQNVWPLVPPNTANQSMLEG